MPTRLKELLNQFLNLFGFHLIKKSTYLDFINQKPEAVKEIVYVPAEDSNNQHLIKLAKHYELIETEKNIYQDFRLNNPLAAKDKEDILHSLTHMPTNFGNNALCFMRNSSVKFLKNLLPSSINLHHNLSFLEELNKEKKKFNEIAILEPNLSAIFCLKPHYLEALRNISQTEVYIAFYIIKNEEPLTDVFCPIAADPIIEQNKIYLSEIYVRQKLHEAGFLEVGGMYTPFYDEIFNISRKMDGSGYYRYTATPKNLLNYKGVAIFHAHRRSLEH